MHAQFHPRRLVEKKPPRFLSELKYMRAFVSADASLETAADINFNMPGAQGDR